MPAYKTIPEPDSLTVRAAIDAGKKSISIPGRNILISGFLLGLVFPCCGAPIWIAPIVIVAGVVWSSLYALWITPKWRIWAYAGVDDIHQFQRRAELESLLPKHSSDIDYGIMTSSERILLRRLQERFLTLSVFKDDATIEALSLIYYKNEVQRSLDNAPRITISSFGITTAEHGFYQWDEIHDESVATKSFSLMNGAGVDVSAGTKDFLTFYCMDGYVSVNLAELDTTVADLDTMLYIHRGRFTHRAKD